MVKQVKDIVIAIGYLGELIMNFFGDGSHYGVNIRYSKEDKPLGTVGGLDLIRGDINETFLLINGDTLTTLEFTDLIDYHTKNGAVSTIALKKRDVQIDFGVVNIDNSNCIERYTEKPAIDYLVSMGVYIFEPEVLEYIGSGERLDFPDLVERLISSGKKVKGFVFDGYWLDIGRAEDYERANKEIETLGRILGFDFSS